jgi:hypothetical protein
LEAHLLPSGKLARADVCQSFVVKTKIDRVDCRARPIKILVVDAQSKALPASAEAAIAPRRAARSAAATATAATAAAAAAATASATATAATTTTAAPGHLLHAALLLVEQMERGEAHIGDFLVTKRDRLRRHEAQFLRRIGDWIGGCGGASRKTESQTRSAQRRHGGFSNSLRFRSLFHSSHRRILHQLFSNVSNGFDSIQPPRP